MKPGKHGFARIAAAVRYSRDGLAAAYRNEAAFRQLVWLHAADCGAAQHRHRSCGGQDFRRAAPAL